MGFIDLLTPLNQVLKLEEDPQRDLSSISDPNIISSLLKRYLRLLNPPLLTHDLYSAFLDSAKDVNDESLRLSRLCACVMKLPPLNHDILAELLKMLQIVLQCQDKNFMGIENLSTVFAPCLIHKQSISGFTGNCFKLHVTPFLAT